MYNKKYIILLCENELIEDKFVNKRRLEIASSDSNFAGKAQNLLFYTKIDGTHELSFDLNKFYFDENTQKTVKNELVDKVVNKCQIEAIIEQPDGEMKSFFMTVNKRTDHKEGKVTTYSYNCNDAYIEELSKNGYSLTFTDSLEDEESGNGTIHDLARRVVEGTDWEYREDLTGTLYEYTTDYEYNFDQERFDETYKPVPTHPIEFLPEANRIASKTEVYIKDDEGYRPVYCYKEEDSVTSNSVQNLLYNSSDFTDVVGWKTLQNKEGTYKEDNTFLVFKSREKDNKKYYDLMAYTTENNCNLLLENNTAAANNTTFQANKLYAFKYKMCDKNQQVVSSASIDEIIFSRQSLSSPSSGSTLSFKTQGGFISCPENQEYYYVLKSNSNSMINPYITLKLKQNSFNTKENPFFLENIELIEIKGKEIRDASGNIISTAQENYSYLLNKYGNGMKIDAADLDKFITPKDVLWYSYYQPTLRYCTRKNYYYTENNELIEKDYDTNSIEELTFLDFKTQVNKSSNYIRENGNWVAYKPKGYGDSSQIDFEDVQSQQGADPSLIYQDKNGICYQYYKIVVPINGQVSSGGMWDYALFGSGAYNKRRTLVAEKSNRFNLIQDLSELFKVWPVFSTYRDGDTVKKEFWFRESCLQETFAGFHAGVNVSQLDRTVESDEIVTKMYVEDIEDEDAYNRVVSIIPAKTNPWGENYYYNFRYYIEQQLLSQYVIENGKKILVVEKDLNELYSSVKEINNQINDIQNRIASLPGDLQAYGERITYYNYAIIARNQEIASLQADLNRKQQFADGSIPLSDADKQAINDKIDHLNNFLGNLEQELQAERDKKVAAQEEYDKSLQDQNELIKEKEDKIKAFEKKYSQYIKEGTWAGQDYVDDDTYFYDSQKVSNTSAEPKISWNIGVLDGQYFEELKEFTVQVGDKTFLIDPDFFDNRKGEHKFEILISGYRDYLDNPIKNEIEVRSYLTSFEDLFQRIAAATQTLELNEQTYDKAALFTPDGIDVGIFQDTLLNNSLVLANSTDNSYIMDNTGITLKSLSNPVKQLRLVADGVYISNSMNDNGEAEWKTGVTADGISASVITAGRINTSEIDIYCGDQVGFKWDALGITAYQSVNSEYSENQFIRLDGFGLYFVNNSDQFGMKDGQPWYSQKSYEVAISNILHSAELSITKLGFNLNIKGSSEEQQGRMTLGYKLETVIDPDTGEAYEQRTNKYGLFIEQKENGIYKYIIQLQDNGDCLLGGWKINQTFLYGVDYDQDQFSITLRSRPEGNSPILAISTSQTYCHISKKGFIITTEGIQIGVTSNDKASLYVSGRSKRVQFDTDLYLNGDLYIPDGQGGWTPVDFSSGGGGGSGDFIIPMHPNGEDDPVMASAWWGSYSGHKGLDLVLKNGDQYGKPIYASRAGTVDDAYASWDPSQGTSGMKSYGNYIRINHGNYQGSNYKTRYAHLLSLVVNIGDQVTQGQLIGYVDSTGNVTGPHLHFEVIKNGVRQDPELYLPPIPHKY